MNNLLSIYILNKKQNNFLILSSLLAIILILVRIKITHSYYMLFLIWNLFLALIPYFISHYIKIDFSLNVNNLKNLICIAIWILFIPNTYYLITDFVHLYHQNNIQFIYDLILLSCFTMTGFYFGMLSIHKIYCQFEFFHSKKTAFAFTLFISYLFAFGIYLGRILRFNSWDIICKPISLFNTILESVFHLETILFTVALGTFITIINSIYFKFKSNY